MNTKRIFALVSALMLILGLCACGGNVPEQTEAPAVEEVTEAPTVEQETEVPEVKYAVMLGEKGYSSLSDAVLAAEDGAQIRLLKNIDMGTQVTIEGEKAITIIGDPDTMPVLTRTNASKYAFRVNDTSSLTLKNVVVDGMGATGKRLFVTSNALTLENVTVQNSYCAGNGGAVYGTGSSTITLIGCTFRNNTAVKDEEGKDGNGGAVYAAGGDTKVTIKDSVFENNSAAGNGGAVAGPKKRSISMEGCTFKNNCAERGGAVYGNGNGDTIYTTTITDCTFENNTAAKGNAVFCPNLSDVTMKNCTIADSDGIAVEFTGDTGADASVLRVSGTVKLGTVGLMFKKHRLVLADRLEAGSAITLIPAVYAQGQQVVTADSTDVLANSVQYITIADDGSGNAWMVDTDGKLCIKQT